MNAVLQSATEHEIVECESGLTYDALNALCEGKTQIVRAPRFTDPLVCRNLAAGLLTEGYNDYLNAPQVGRIGMSYFETGGRQELKNFYFNTALENIEKLRKACAPYQCPIDVFRCVMDEIWPEGANLQTVSGRKMFVGLSRNMRPSTPLLAHHDMFARLAPEEQAANDLVRQMAVNVYIDVPEVGGELLMWRNEISDAEFLERRGSKYGMEIEPLGKPDLIIKPQVGELIIFNARKLHAVAAGAGSDRLTVSCFLGYRGRHKPLTMWS